MLCRARAVAILVAVGALPSAAALAQSGPVAAERAATSVPASNVAGAAEAPSASGSATAYPATGYGWTPPKAAHALRGRLGSHRSGGNPEGSAVPGFETLGDGTSRLFVQLSRPVSYVARPGHGSITYVLQGAQVGRRNNTNPLVTVHFNTPVTEARLLPHGRDLWLVVELRANVQPVVSMDVVKDGGAILHIAFPKGDYLPGEAALEPPSRTPSASP